MAYLANAQNCLFRRGPSRARSYTRTPPCRWIEGPSRATLLQMEGLAVSSFAPPAGLLGWLGWLGWTALHAIFRRAASVPSVPSQPYCVCSCSRPASLKEKMSCTSYLAANELQSASGDELRWALTGLAGFAGLQGDSFGGDNASTNIALLAGPPPKSKATGVRTGPAPATDGLSAVLYPVVAAGWVAHLGMSRCPPRALPLARAAQHLTHSCPSQRHASRRGRPENFSALSETC